MQETQELGFDAWLGKTPGVENGNLLQYSCLGNPMDRGACRLQSMGSQRVGYDWAWCTLMGMMKTDVCTWSLFTWSVCPQETLSHNPVTMWWEAQPSLVERPCGAPSRPWLIAPSEFLASINLPAYEWGFLELDLLAIIKLPEPLSYEAERNCPIRSRSYFRVISKQNDSCCFKTLRVWSDNWNNKCFCMGGSWKIKSKKLFCVLVISMFFSKKKNKKL